MDREELQKILAGWLKAELHLHLEGSIAPATVVELAARHGQLLTGEEAEARYAYRDFAGFLEAFKWVSSYLRTPADYAFVAARLAEELQRQNVIYAEVTISAGVMLRRRQNVEANFAALRDAAGRAKKHGLRLAWIFDAARQFGPQAAMRVARLAVELRHEGVIAFGMGGDELAIPTTEFRHVYEFARGAGLRAVAHAGEIGGAELVREAVELLGAERIGHGIAAMHDPTLVECLAERRIALEICPTSNLCTGALSRQLAQSDVNLAQHPMKRLFKQGVRVTLSTDDPAMFHTDLLQEYLQASDLGFTASELAQISRNSFLAAFLPADEKQMLLGSFQNQVMQNGLV